MNFFQAGFSRLTERDPETTTAISFCQLNFVIFLSFFGTMKT